jgi:murein DD-endopeptidase MepM/ murein hydrolase activator NlpD
MLPTALPSAAPTLQPLVVHSADLAAQLGSVQAGTSQRSHRTLGPFAPPTEASVLAPFDMSQGAYGPGNFGIDYATSPGTTVTFIGPGTVTFAGWVAGQFWVSIDHGAGLVSSYGPMETTTAVAGQVVRGGEPAGTVAGPLHLGVRRGGSYVDPATLWTTRIGHARLDDTSLGNDAGNSRRRR